MLRDTSHFSWTMVPLFVIVVYFYFRQAEQQHWARIFAALAFWGMDWINEIANGLVDHFTGKPVWGIAHESSWLILIGLTIEITLMFAVLGLASTLLLPADKHARIAGVNNRLVLAVANSILCVMVEIALNHFGMLTWAWPWWNATHPLPIFLFGYMPFFLVAYWVYDMPDIRQQLKAVGAILSIDAVALSICLWMGLV